MPILSWEGLYKSAQEKTALQDNTWGNIMRVSGAIDPMLGGFAQKAYKIKKVYDEVPEEDWAMRMPINYTSKNFQQASLRNKNNINPDNPYMH